ncbi:MAG: flagellar hook-length control protein FliK [Acidimicrobiia bacterium]
MKIESERKLMPEIRGRDSVNNDMAAAFGLMFAQAMTNTAVTALSDYPNPSDHEPDGADNTGGSVAQPLDAMDASREATTSASAECAGVVPSESTSASPTGRDAPEGVPLIGNAAIANPITVTATAPAPETPASQVQLPQGIAEPLGGDTLRSFANVDPNFTPPTSQLPDEPRQENPGAPQIEPHAVTAEVDVPPLVSAPSATATPMEIRPVDGATPNNRVATALTRFDASAPDPATLLAPDQIPVTPTKTVSASPTTLASKMPPSFDHRETQSSAAPVGLEGVGVLARPNPVSSPPAATPATTAPNPNFATPTPAQQLVAVLAPLRVRPDGTTRLTLGLRPDHLGSVEVELRIEKGVVHVHLRAEQPATADLLRDTVDDLRGQFAQQGITAGDVSVGSNAARHDRQPAPAATVPQLSEAEEPQLPITPTTNPDKLVDVRM